MPEAAALSQRCTSACARAGVLYDAKFAPVTAPLGCGDRRKSAAEDVEETSFGNPGKAAGRETLDEKATCKLLFPFRSLL